MGLYSFDTGQTCLILGFLVNTQKKCYPRIILVNLPYLGSVLFWLSVSDCYLGATSSIPTLASLLSWRLIIKIICGHSSPSPDRRRAVNSYWQKHLHLVMVAPSGGLCRTSNSVFRLNCMATHDLNIVNWAIKSQISKLFW